MEKINMLTVRELADKLNVSHTTIYHNRPDDIPFTKIDGVNYIDEELEKIITEKVSSRRQNKKPKQKNKNDYDEQYIQKLQNEIESLKEQYNDDVDYFKNQLSNRDKQIDQYSKLLENQQILALQSNKKVEELETTLNQIENKKEEDNTQEGHSKTEYEQQNKPDVNDSKKEKGFFSKLFSSK